MSTILLIDDDLATTRMMTLLLELDGHTVQVATKREEALQLMADKSPNMVLLDYVMPGLDAGTFISQARKAGYQGRILLCTAMHADIDLPVDAVIFKPFDPDHLSKVVNSL